MPWHKIYSLIVTFDVMECTLVRLVPVTYLTLLEKGTRILQTLIESRWKSISTAFLIDRPVSCFLWRCQTLHNCDFSHTPLPLPLSISVLSIILLFTHHYLGHLFQISLRSSFSIALSSLALLCLSVWVHFLSITLFFSSPAFSVHLFLRSIFGERVVLLLVLAI